MIFSKESPIAWRLLFFLFIVSGILFLYEAWKNKDDELNKPSVFQIILLSLYAVYPLFSVAFGATFPQMVTHIMPCPVTSLSIVAYSGYKLKNRVLLALLTIWGFTGIKSIFFNVYEDLILLICGFYGLFVLIKMFQNGKVKKWITKSQAKEWYFSLTYKFLPNVLWS